MMHNKSLRFELLRDETVLLEIRPHWLAFYGHYFVWAVVFVFSLNWNLIAGWGLGFFTTQELPSQQAILNEVMVVFPESNLNANLTQLEGGATSFGLVSLWIASLFAFGLAVSVLKINFRWVLGMLTLGGVSILVSLLFDSLALAPMIGALLALGGMISVEWYRKRHFFVITNFRIITAVSAIGYQERELHFSHVSDLTLDQSLLGRLFDFGTLLPISDSGFGVGSDIAGAAVGGSYKQAQLSVFGAGAVSAPRARSAHALFGVPNPHHVHNEIEQLIHDSAAVTQLVGLRQDLKNKASAIAPEEDRVMVETATDYKT